MKKYLYITIPLILLAVFLSLKLLPSERGGREGFNNGDLPSAEAAAPKTGLVGHWTMDVNDMSITGATIYDKSGQNNHGTFAGTTTSTGRIGQARDFNGTSDWMSIPNMDIAASGATLSAWFKADTIANNIIFGKIADTDTYVYLPNTTTVSVQTDVSGTVKNYTVPTMSTGVWYHLIVTRDSDTTRVYLNGVQSSSNGQTQTDVMTVNEIGRYSSGASGLWWDGLIDDVRIYNRALSAAEVANLYSSAKTSYIASAPKQATSTSAGRLISWWTMDTNDMSTTGATLYDKSGQNNHGTVTGTTTSTGRINQSRTFNGTSAKVSNTNFDGTQISSGSFSFWANLAATQNSNAVLFNVGKSANSDVVELYVVGTGGIIELFVYDNSVTKGTPRSTISINDNKWHHIAGTWSSAGAVLYIDNVLMENDTTNSAITFATGYTLMAGAYAYTGTSNYFTGSLDDVRVYSYALSAQEVANLYSSAKTKYVASAPKTGLVGWWTMDANDATSTPWAYYDKSEFNNTATSTANPTFTKGKIEQAAQLNGSTQYFTVSDATSLTLSNNMTISTWIKPTLGAAQYILSKGVYNQDGYLLGLAAGGNVDFYTSQSGAAQRTYTSTVLKSGVWTHLVVKLTSGTPAVFLNNVEASYSLKPTHTAPADGATALFIGRATGATLYALNGSLDDFRIYNRALSTAEIANLYQSAAKNYQ